MLQFCHKITFTAIRSENPSILSVHHVSNSTGSYSFTFVHTLCILILSHLFMTVAYWCFGSWFQEFFYCPISMKYCIIVNIRVSYNILQGYTLVGDRISDDPGSASESSSLVRIQAEEPGDHVAGALGSLSSHVCFRGCQAPE